MGRGFTLAERSSAAPAVISFGPRIALAWTGTDRHINLTSSLDGRHFDATQRLGYTSSTTKYTTGPGHTIDPIGPVSVSNAEMIVLAPALAPIAGGLALAWTGTDRRVNVARMSSGAPDHMTLPETSSVAPALAARDDDELLLAWTGMDRRLNVSTTRDGVFAPASVIDAKSSTSPAVCVFGDEAALAWTGTDHDVNVVILGQSASTRALRLDETSSSAPALCVSGDAVTLAWVGRDRHINVDSTVLGNSEPVRLGETSSFAPSICGRDGDIILAWTGSDRHLNLMRHRP